MDQVALTILKNARPVLISPNPAGPTWHNCVRARKGSEYFKSSQIVLKLFHAILSRLAMDLTRNLHPLIAID